MAIADFKHRVAVCTMHDVVEQGGNMILRRADAYHAWAKIVPSVGGLFNGAGNAIKQSGDVRTHKLTIRFRTDIDFTQTAWFFEQRLQSGGRWFKLLSMYEKDEAGRFLECNVRLVSRGAVVPPSQTQPERGPLPFGATAVPDGVKL